MTWVLILILAGGVAAFVLAPLFRPDAAEAERVAAGLGASQDLASQREMALAALRDLEDDRATGKIGDADYAEMKARLSSRAVAILDSIDAAGDAAPRPDASAPPKA